MNLKLIHEFKAKHFYIFNREHCSIYYLCVVLFALLLTAQCLPGGWESDIIFQI